MIRWRVRTLMVVVLYLAIDLGSYHVMLTNGSGLALAVFLVLTGLIPLLLVLWLIGRWIWRDHTRTTIY